MTARHDVSVLSLSLCGALLQACVSSDAGVEEARSAVSARTELEMRHRASDPEAIERARELLLSKPLTAESAAKIAVLQNPNVQAALDEIGIARGDLVTALRLPNPDLEGRLVFRGENGTQVELGATITLTDFILIPLRAAAASDELDAASLEAAGAAIDVGFEAKRFFFDLQAAQQALELEKTVAFAMAQSADVAQRLLEAGNVPELDTLNERALFEESRLGVARAEVEDVAARERLGAMLGLWGPDVGALKVDGRLTDPPESEVSVADLERRAVAESLDLKILKLRYAAAAGRADAARAEGWIPEVGAGVSAEREEDAWGIGPQVRVELPLFYQGQGRIDRALAERSATMSRHDAAALHVRQSARTLATRLRAARERALFYKKTLLPLRERIVDESQRQYNAMNMGVFQLLLAKRDQVQTARAYVEALRDYWATRSEVDQLLAGRIPAGASRMGPEQPTRESAGGEH